MIRTNLAPLAVVYLTLFAVAAGSAQGSGRVRWRFEIPTNFSGKFIGVGADGRIYTTSFDPGTMYALRPDGSLIWTLNLNSASGHWPISFGYDGSIYTGAVGVTAVNPDGTLRWAFDPPGSDWVVSGPNIGPDGNIYAATTVDRGGLGVFSLDANGNLRWSNPGDPELFDGPPDRLDEIVFGEGRFFAGINFRRSGPWSSSYSFDFEGNQLWFRQYGSQGGPSSNPRMHPDGRLIFREGQGRLMAMSQDGTADWVVPHPDGAQILVTPAIGPDGSIYAGDQYGVQLWSANPDGSTRWVHGSVANDYLGWACLGVSPDNGVLIASGWSYVGGLNRGWIRGYDPGNGALLWQLDLPEEQGMTQLTRSVRPAFSASGDTAYLTTWFSGNGVGHSYLYAIKLRDVVEPRLSKLTLNPTSVRGGASSTGTVILTAAAAEDMLVTLASDNVSANVPPSVVVPAGNTQVSFTVTTYAVKRNTAATITASRTSQSTAAKLRITRN